MLFDSLYGLARVAVIGVCAYVALVFLLRISDKRTRSSLRAFDAVVTIAMGSTLSTVILSKDVELAEGVLAFAVLIWLQFAVTWLDLRSRTVRRLVNSEPKLLFRRGEFLRVALKSERVTEGEVRAASWQEGIVSIDEVGAVVLEADASFSVIKNLDENSASALADVERGAQEKS